MTNKGPGAPDVWIGGDTLLADDLLDSIAEHKYGPAFGFATGITEIVTIIPHGSTTVMSGVTAAGDIYASSDGGKTWTSKNTTPDAAGFLVTGRTDKTLGFFIERTPAGGNFQTAYTDDSGTTWTSKTDANFSGNEVIDVSMPSSALIVLAGADGTNNIVYSTDQGGTWNDPTTPVTSTVRAMNMFSDTVGYAVDTSGNIWKTTDGADVWADTGDNVSNYAGNSERTKMYCATADLVIFFNDGKISLYTNSTNNFTHKVDLKSSEMRETGGIIETSSGAIYVLAITNDTTIGAVLAKSTDEGDTWTQTLIDGEMYTVSGALDKKQIIAEWGTNHIVLSLPIIRVMYEGD